jgi:hypothetical protein
VADIPGLLKDPQFNALDAASQKAVLGKIDPSFGSLSDQDYTAFRQRMGSAAPQGRTAAQQLGITNSWAAAPLDLVEGIGAGVMSTVRGVSKLAHRVLPAVPELPPEYAQAPDSVAGTVGKYGEQAAEFMAPVGLIGRAAKVVQGATAGMRGARVANVATRALVEGASAGVVATVQTGSPSEGIDTAKTAGMVSGGMQAVAPLVQKALPLVRNRLDPVKQVAMDWAEKHGIRLSTGQRTGNQMVTKMERGLENTFGSSGRTQDFFQGQAGELEAAGRGLVNRTQPGASLNPFEAGEKLSQRVQSVIADAKANADTLYSDVRSQYAANSHTVQVGVKTSPVLGPNGQPIQTPVMKTFELPVDVKAAKARLTPLFEELNVTMPEAKRQMSPGFQALKQIIEGPDVMDAVTADRNLSALKSLARGGNNQYLNSRSQGLAKVAIGQISADFDAALNAANPTILPKLQQARTFVKNQHTVAEILNALPDEPAALYQRVTSAGDRTYTDLAFLNRIAPGEMRQVGRTYLEGLFQKATNEGGFNRAAGVMADWNKLGPKTKSLLFGNQANVSELNKFFLAAKQLTQDPNPSGTGKLISTLGILGAGIDAFRTEGTLQDKAERFGVDVISLGATSNLLSRLLLTPGGAKLLTGVMTLPPKTPAFRQALNGVVSLVERNDDGQGAGTWEEYKSQAGNQ